MQHRQDGYEPVLLQIGSRHSHAKVMHSCHTCSASSAMQIWLSGSSLLPMAVSSCSAAATLSAQGMCLEQRMSCSSKRFCDLQGQGSDYIQPCIPSMRCAVEQSTRQPRSLSMSQPHAMAASKGTEEVASMILTSHLQQESRAASPKQVTATCWRMQRCIASLLQ